MLSLFGFTPMRNVTRATLALTHFSFPLGNHIDIALPGVLEPAAAALWSRLRNRWPPNTAARIVGAAAVVVTEAQQYRYFSSDSHNNMENKTEKVAVDKEELRKRLTPLQYQVTQEAATERPFTGCYNKHYEKGVYQCIVCHQDLFSSDTKYDSGCGWPAFNDVLDKGKITLHRDASIPGMVRTEVRCSKCSAHMGHVFDDGPAPKFHRYCINSASIDFVPIKQNATASAAASASASISTAASASASASSSAAAGNKAAPLNGTSAKAANSQSGSSAASKPNAANNASQQQAKK